MRQLFTKGKSTRPSPSANHHPTIKSGAVLINPDASLDAFAARLMANARRQHAMYPNRGLADHDAG